MPSTEADPSPVQASVPAAPARALSGTAPHSTGVRLLTFTPAGGPSAQAGIFALDSGSIVAVRGLPVGCMGDGFRLASSDRWVVGWRPYGNAADPCTGPGRIYVVDAAAGTARLVASAAGGAAPAEDDSFWTLTDAAPAATPGGLVPQQVQHFDVTGAPLSPLYRLPAGMTLVRGLAPDLLMLRQQLDAGGPDNFQQWRPSSGAVLRRHERVLASNGAVIAWVDGCTRGNCPVHLSRSGQPDTTVPLPSRAYAIEGSLSTDSRYLALTLGTSVDANGGTNENTGVLVDVATSTMQTVPQTRITVGEQLPSLGLYWAGPSWLMVFVPGAPTDYQVGAYNVVTHAFVVSSKRMPRNVAFSAPNPGS